MGIRPKRNRDKCWVSGGTFLLYLGQVVLPYRGRIVLLCRGRVALFHRGRVAPIPRPYLELPTGQTLPSLGVPRHLAKGVVPHSLLGLARLQLEEPLAPKARGPKNTPARERSGIHPRDRIPRADTDDIRPKERRDHEKNHTSSHGGNLFLMHNPDTLPHSYDR